MMLIEIMVSREMVIEVASFVLDLTPIALALKR
jgi:hypothetical protein